MSRFPRQRTLRPFEWARLPISVYLLTPLEICGYDDELGEAVLLWSIRQAFVSGIRKSKSKWPRVCSRKALLIPVALVIVIVTLAADFNTSEFDLISLITHAAYMVMQEGVALESITLAERLGLSNLYSRNLSIEIIFHYIVEDTPETTHWFRNLCVSFANLPFSSSTKKPAPGGLGGITWGQISLILALHSP